MSGTRWLCSVLSLLGTLENGFKGVKGFLAQWATAKLHRFTVTCFFSLFLSFLLVSVPYGFGSIPSHCWLPLPVAASDLSAPKKCRARFGLDQQNNWCGPCRCVWCVLAPARARWRLAYCTLGLPPSRSAAAFSSSPPPSVCSARLSWPLSFLQPRPAGLSLGPHYVICTSCLGRRVFTAYARLFVWMLSVRMCLWLVGGTGISLQGVKYNKCSELVNWQVWAWRIWSPMVWSLWRMSQCCQPKPKPWLHVFVCAMTCPFSSFFFLSLCVCLCLPLWLTDANTPKKCRALFGLDQLSLWCKPCRYNCCSTNGRKTSTKSSFFSLIIIYF